MLRLPDPSPAGERMAVKLLRDQIRQRHHPEHGDIPHHPIDPVREVPARVLRVILPTMAMAVRVPIAGVGALIQRGGRAVAGMLTIATAGES